MIAVWAPWSELEERLAQGWSLHPAAVGPRPMYVLALA
jgi:hypothetical protein